ncbi:kinase-like protein [Pseudovirgaria hyperparasitica]|uniref:Kinase-like protein n=1 Tax=Pseudovirgaria hyperparasitica TaxID=470096 RepID=A0A6A6W340_9PEZI|nr:kinase-like protein [Pseudovirgaria hyperparasitica]KAF2757272.1 kinase-like protein [Pseudovirgaria hyperparasitica]
MSDGDIHVVAYFPEGVKYILDFGSTHYIGFVDDTTVLKYPHFKEELDGLAVEWQIYQRLGKHPRITDLKGRHKDGGIFLEYARNGSLQGYLESNAPLNVETKLRLAKETADGVAHAHRQNVLICDIAVRNILVDSELHVKLCDFQGKIIGPDGTVILSGGASENADSYKPRDNPYDQNVSTDIFALGSTIYYIMTGHRPFPKLDTIQDELKINESYRQGLFPRLDIAEEIVHKCWSGKYTSASEVVSDLAVLRRSYVQSSELGQQLQQD